MKKLYLDIYRWTKQPDDTELNLRPKEKLQVLGKILLLDFLVVIPVLVLLEIIHSHFVALEIPLDDSHPVTIFFLAGLAAPVIEEFIFRFPLKYKRNYLVRLLSFLSKGWLKDKWSKIFKYFLYLSVALFGLVHLQNYDNREAWFYALSPFIVGSQLFGGLLLSYSRIKLGFVWSVLQHSTFNLVIAGLGVMLIHNQHLVEESTENVSVSIVEQAYVDTFASYYKTKTNKDTIYLVEANDISLSNLLDSLQLNEMEHYEDAWIDVKIHSEGGIDKSELEKIIMNGMNSGY